MSYFLISSMWNMLYTSYYSLHCCKHRSTHRTRKVYAVVKAASPIAIIAAFDAIVYRPQYLHLKQRVSPALVFGELDE